jgi:NAD(P)H dehydrogenase (quinone)
MNQVGGKPNREEDAGHTNETVDLYAVRFNPVLGMQGFANWLPDENVPDVVEKVLRERVLVDNANPLQRFMASAGWHGDI